MRRLAPSTALIACLGCGAAESEPLPSGDFTMFINEVEPVLEQHCANPSCHGNGERPLELFAPERHRLDPDDVFLKTPLSHEELRANFLRASAFIDDFDGTSSLLRKPIAPSAGGMEHEGGVCFESTDEPAWQAMRRWVRAALGSKDDA